MIASEQLHVSQGYLRLGIAGAKCYGSLNRSDGFLVAAIHDLHDAKNRVRRRKIWVELQRTACLLIGALAGRCALHDVVERFAPDIDCHACISREGFGKGWVELL